MRDDRGDDDWMFPVRNKARAKGRQLIETLRTGRAKARAQAAGELSGYGPEAVEPLCDALRLKSAKVRIAAACSLGEIGDARAVPALMEALRACFDDGSARRQLWRGRKLLLQILLIETVVIIYAVYHPFGYADAAGHASFYGIVYLLWYFCYYFGARRERGGVIRALTAALADIAERDPVPELRGVLPELEAIDADVLQQTGATRRASWSAARKIESVTRSWAALPLPGSPPHPSADGLPRPAAPAAGRET